MNRYWVHDKGKPQRDVVLLQSYPCIGKGRCIYCNYHVDNAYDGLLMSHTNEEVLKQVWVNHSYDCLQITNSGSYYELPLATQECIYTACKKFPVFTTLILEARWEYRDYIIRTKELYQSLGVKVLFYLGVESWNYNIRKVLGKDWVLTPKGVKDVGFDGVNILVGHELQTEEDVSLDLEITRDNFEYAMINIYKNRTGLLKENTSLVNNDIFCFVPSFEVNRDPDDWDIGDKA